MKVTESATGDGQYDLVIRGGQVVDGTGAEPFVADIAVDGATIVAIGNALPPGRRELDACGLLVTPGFVDIHTHYDGQVFWTSQLAPSSAHGVTTIVMGNCGVGFAPCRAADRERLVRLMEGVEDIPGAVLAEGLPWDWETFPDYLDRLASRQFDVDVAAQVPHAALRVYVMGERGANREPATAADIAQMRELVAEAIEAGALGVSTSRTLNHRTSDGNPTPTLEAARAEILGLADGLADAGTGVFQLVSDFTDLRTEQDLLEDVCRRSGRPLSFSLAQAEQTPDGWRPLLHWLETCHAQGLVLRAQVCGRGVGLLLGLTASLHPFRFHPGYLEVAALPLAERVAALREPARAARLIAEPLVGAPAWAGGLIGRFDRLYPMADPPDYEPESSTTFAAQAAATGQSVAAMVLEALLAEDGQALLYLPFANYAQGTLEPAREMLEHPYTVPGLGDGGAHLGMIADASFTTWMLTHWVRDRKRGARFTLPFAVHAMTARTADAVGLCDRGRLLPGLRADLNLIDLEGLQLLRPRIVEDLPAGGRRLLQAAVGYRATLVAGQVVALDGVPTGALPGRLVRGARAAGPA